MSRCPPTVLPQIKEYERVCTTVVNAYVGPALERYLGRLATRLAEAGYRGPILIIQSHGGLATIADAVRLAAGGVLSGPAGGVAGSRHCRAPDRPARPDPVRHGRHQHRHLAGRWTARPRSPPTGGSPASASRCRALDIVSIGAGGGSIARVDAGGVLHVGPESAGAEPGPACYGRGGTEATVTDANLVLGLLDPDNFLGGRARLDRRAAEARGRPDRRGARRRAHGRGRGHPPRDQHAHGRGHPPGLGAARASIPAASRMLAFGGAAGLHVTDVARQLGLRPRGRAAPRRGALGLGHADLGPALRGGAHPYRRCQPARRRGAARSSSTSWRPRAGAGCGRVVRWAGAGAALGRHALRRADLRGRTSASTASTGRLRTCSRSSPRAFHRRHEELYTYAMPDQEAVLVNARVAVIGVLPDPPQEPALPDRPPAAPRDAAPGLSRRLAGGAGLRLRRARARARPSPGRR